jgi:hypothetical protein
MATIAGKFDGLNPRSDALSGTERAHAIDRWIFVFMAVWYIAIVLTGFIPDSIMKVGMVQAGQRPPFPLVLHMHAVLMGSFLLILLAQTTLMATGRRAMHMQLGILGMVIGGLLIIVGFVLAPTMYWETWNGLKVAPPAQRAPLQDLLSLKENILLLQGRIGIVFPLLLLIGLRARRVNDGLHKRMMILAPGIAIEAGIARIGWLPTTMPASPIAMDFYLLLAASPMIVWDIVRNRRVHEAYWIAAAIIVPVTIAIEVAWDKPWWHQAAKVIMGVG